MTHALRTEWTKLRTIRSTAWLFVAAVVITVVTSAALAGSVDTSHCPSPTQCNHDTTKLVLTGVWLGQVAIVVLAALAMTNEYGTRMIHSTLAANPRRVQVLLAKAAVVTSIVLPAATFSVLGSLVVGRAILQGNGFTAANGYPPLSLADEPTLRAAAGTVLYLGLIALLSLGLGTAIRDTAGAVTVILGLLFAFPIIAQFVSDPLWSERLQRLAPMSAGLAIQETQGLEDLPVGPWAGLGVLAIQSSASLFVGGITLKTRDA
jgi:ABC-2 type transport system permease protein